MALTTIAALKEYLRVDSRDLEVDAFAVWNADSTAKSAVVESNGTAIVLTKVGGVTPGVVTLALATYPTLTLLVAAINASGASWAARLYADGTRSTSLLSFMGPRDCLSWEQRVLIQMSWDGLLTNILERAEAFMAGFCRRTFEAATYTQEVYSGDGTNLLKLRNFPVTALTLIERRDGTTWSTVDSTLYSLDAEKGFVYLELAEEDSSYVYWTFGWNNYRVTYTAGYTVIPTDLVMIALELAAEAYFKLGRDERLKGERIGSYSRTMIDSSFPPGVLDKLALWARVE